MLGNRRDLIGVGQARRSDREQPGQLVIGEASEGEVEAEALQVTQLKSQQVVVPAGVQRQLVIGDDVGALLRLAQPGKLDDRHRGHPELPCCKQPAVPGDDAVRAIDEDRIGPAELADRSRDLRHLRIGVRARIVGEGSQRRERTVLDGQRRTLGSWCRAH
jgi:hypothetical protein